ncbi:peptide chain release factor H [Marivirga lumbricoides]|uniref:Peptide chain release factor H n=1 Tax=Marivirga lumbricoides TaxID=1046115 RepID=A0A2T4DU29_9BACT|nr:peptide chain release factor H [Marivirga lumbricoides]
MERNQTIYIQISAGRGPAECCWVVAQALKRLLAEAKASGLHSEVIDRQEGIQNGSLFSVLIAVTGQQVYSQLAHWQGTIQWIGQSPYRKYHKRKNWFIGVSFFKPKNKDQQLKMSEVVCQTFRGSGPGGQHRNKVETAVRATHAPTGVSTTSSEARSQHQNKQLAFKKLEQLLKSFEIDQQRELINEQWMQHLSLERGNAVLVFEGRKFIQR